MEIIQVLQVFLRYILGYCCIDTLGVEIFLQGISLNVRKIIQL